MSSWLSTKMVVSTWEDVQTLLRECVVTSITYDGENYWVEAYCLGKPPFELVAEKEN